MKRAFLPALLALTAIVSLHAALRCISSLDTASSVASLRCTSRSWGEVPGEVPGADRGPEILRPAGARGGLGLTPINRSPTLPDGDTPLFRLAHPAQDTYHYTEHPVSAAEVQPRFRRAADRHPPDHPRMRPRAPRHVKGLCAARGAARLAHLIGDMRGELHDGNAFMSASGPLRFVADSPTGWRATRGRQRARLSRIASTSTPTGTPTSSTSPCGTTMCRGRRATRLPEVPVSAMERQRRYNAWPERWVNDALVYAKGSAPGHPAHGLPWPGRCRTRAAARWRDRTTRRIRRALARHITCRSREGIRSPGF